MQKSISYILKLSSKTFKAGLAGASRAVKGFTGKVKASLRTAGSAFKSFGSKITGAIASPLAVVGTLTASIYKLGQSALKGARDFRELEKNFADISTLMDGKLSESAKKSIESMSTTYGTDIQKNARAYYDIVSSGVKGEKERADTLKYANKLAVAGNVDIDKATSLIMSLRNAYKVTNEQAVEWALGVVKLGRTTVPALARSVGMVAGLAKQAGVGFNEFGAILAEGSKTMPNISIVISNLKQVLSNLLKVTPQAQEELEKLGIKGFNVATVKAKGLGYVLSEVYQKTDKFKNVPAVTKIFGSTEAVALVLDVAKNLKNTIAEMANLTGTLEKSLAKAMSTFDRRLSIIQNKIDETYRQEGSWISELTIGWKKIELAIGKAFGKVVKFVKQVNDIRLALDKIIPLTKSLKAIWSVATSPWTLLGKVGEQWDKFHKYMMGNKKGVPAGASASASAGASGGGGKSMQEKLRDAVDSRFPRNPMPAPAEQNKATDIHTALNNIHRSLEKGVYVNIKMKGDANRLFEAKAEKSAQNKTQNRDAFGGTVQ